MPRKSRDWQREDGKAVYFPHESPMLPTVRGWSLCGETEGNMSYSTHCEPTHQERCWVFTNAQCLSKSPMITWQSYIYDCLSMSWLHNDKHKRGIQNVCI